MPEEDCDELEAQAAEAEKRWEHCKQELEILFTVQEAFLESIEEIEQQPFEILQNHLFQAVKILTGQRYEYGRMDPASFAFGLQHAEGYVLPLDLLSAGTYDALALAFRLALLEQCFPRVEVYWYWTIAWSILMKKGFSMRCHCWRILPGGIR